MTQERSNEPKAIGRVISFTPSAYGNQGSVVDGINPFDPLYNIGVDILEVEILNGQFTKGYLGEDLTQDGRIDGQDLVRVLSDFGLTGGPADLNEDGIVDGQDLVKILAAWDQAPKPIMGQSSGGIRLVDPSFNGGLYTSITYDTSWLDLPINIMVNDIEYSNLTN